MKVERTGVERAPFTAEKLDGGLRLRGPLVFATAASAFRELVALLPASGSRAVDLSGLTASDSAGLATLVSWRAEAARRGVHLRFTAPGSELRALARLSDLDADLFQ